MVTSNDNGNDVVYASYNGVAVWRSPERPLVKIAGANRTDALTVVARLKDSWIEVRMADGTAGFVQGSAVTATPYVAPAPTPAPMAAAPLAAAPAYGAATPATVVPARDVAPPAVAAANAAAPVGSSACASCGRALAGDAAFCAGCGTPRPVVAAARDTTCGACGRTNDADAVFCAGCGRRTDDKPQQAADGGQRAAVSAGAPATPAPPTHAASPPPPPPYAPPPPPAPSSMAQPPYAATSYAPAPAYAPGTGGANTMSLQMPASIVHPEFIAFALANLVLMVSAFMPWEDWGLGTRSGLDVNRGWLVLVAALVAGGMAAWAAFNVAGVPFLRWVQGGSAIVGYGMALLELSLIGDAKGECETGDFLICAAPDPGLGVMAALLAGNALAGLALIRNHTGRSYLLCVVLGPVGAGIEYVIRTQQRNAPAA